MWQMEHEVNYSSIHKWLFFCCKWGGYALPLHFDECLSILTSFYFRKLKIFNRLEESWWKVYVDLFELIWLFSVGVDCNLIVKITSCWYLCRQSYFMIKFIQNWAQLLYKSDLRMGSQIMIIVSQSSHATYADWWIKVWSTDLFKYWLKFQTMK